MKQAVILDTGPLVAFFNRRDRYHAWVVEEWAVIRPPLLTCEAVITEACHLLRSYPQGATAVMDLLRRGVLQIAFRLEEQGEAVALLLKKYANVRISLADACLVRMADTTSGSCMLTLDTDFRLYRRANRTRIPTLMPPDR